MRPKTLIFGIVCVLYGIYGLIECFYIKNDFAEMAGVTVFVVFVNLVYHQPAECKEKVYRIRGAH